MASTSQQTTSESPPSSSSLQLVVDDTIYVAVGSDLKKSKSTLSWALHNFPANKFCILHVIQLPKDNMTCGLEDQMVRTIRELGREMLQKVLNDYILICEQAGVYADKLQVEMDDIGEGIVHLVYQHSIKKLVMGAVADSEGINYVKSKKAMYVEQHVPHSCQIWFICGGHLIHTGEGGLDGFDDKDISASLQVISISESGQSNASAPQIQDGSSDDQLLDQLEQALAEAEKSKREAFEESIRRVKAEKAAIEAIRKARALERSYSEEFRWRKELEKLPAKIKEDFENMKKQRDEERLIALDQRILLESQIAKKTEDLENLKKQLNEERMISMDQRVLLESQIASYKFRIKEFNEKELSGAKLSEGYKKKRDEVSSSINTHQFFSVFSLSEIRELSRNFDPTLKIREQEYRSIYKAVLHHTPVAIKVLKPDSSQGPTEFRQEVDVMSKFRHPNVITLIGACPVACALIYEYLPNGSLEDQLSRKNNTPPLSWQTRIHVATDICSVLVFLHSSDIVHGDLKADNILLDAHFICKLSDFGKSRYLQYLETEEVSPKSDIFSFGVILLQLLTGRPSLDIVPLMQEVVYRGNLDKLLDSSAGNWPFDEAEVLADLALKCCDNDQGNRPDYASELVKVLEPIRASCGTSSSVWRMGSKELNQPPSCFICPIAQEIMKEPHFAADGFTYEAKSMKQWLERGHDTSPMTNLRLPHHNLIPNHALRSAIQEWLQQH